LWHSNKATALSKIGDVFVELHDLNGALNRYRAALAIVERLPQLTDGKMRPTGMLFDTRIRIGVALTANRDVVGALGEFKIALQLSEPILLRDASDSTWQINASIAQKKIGDALKSQQELPGAIQQYLTAVAISDQLWRKDTTNSERQVAVAEDRLALAEAYHESADRDNARQQYVQVIYLLEGATEAHPANQIWPQKLENVRQRLQMLAHP
jgi:tetratricopeptide (TPR) repeat protein